MNEEMMVALCKCGFNEAMEEPRESVLSRLCSVSDLLGVEDRVDEQTFEVLKEVKDFFHRRLQLSESESVALDYLLGVLNRDNMPPEYARNAAFKAALTLGLKVPSCSF